MSEYLKCYFIAPAVKPSMKYFCKIIYNINTGIIIPVKPVKTNESLNWCSAKKYLGNRVIGSNWDFLKKTNGNINSFQENKKENIVTAEIAGKLKGRTTLK